MLQEKLPASKLTWFDSDKCFIDGRWVKAQSGERLPVEDPSRGVEIGEIARGQAADIDAAVEAAERALRGAWGRLTAAERGRLLAKLAGLISARVDELALIEALDVGKPVKQGRADALAMARYMEFYAGAADKVMGETIPYLDGYTVYTLREPHGVTGHIVPWNYPMQIAGRTIGAALAMGNACVLKPAEEACLTSLALADLAREAGFPAGALNVVPGLGEEAGAALAAHPGVRHISFTGSVAVGALVQAAAARHVAPVTLELGGKSPQLVFADADLDRALPFLVNAGIQNAGQTCSAASRILVERSRLRGSRRADGRALQGLAGRPGRRRPRRRTAHFRSPEDDRHPLHRRGRRPHDGREGRDRRRRAGRRTLRRPDPVRRRRAAIIVSRRRKSSAPSRWSFPSTTRPRPRDRQWDRLRSRGRGMDRRRRAADAARQGASRRARCSSTITARAAASSCRSEGSANRAMAARRGSRRSTASRR